MLSLKLLFHYVVHFCEIVDHIFQGVVNVVMGNASEIGNSLLASTQVRI